MKPTSKVSELSKSKLAKQFADFEKKSRIEFDDNGWQLFSDKILEYTNDLYVGTRREFIARAESDPELKYSGKDLERAAMRLDFQRLYGIKRKRYGYQIGGLICSLIVGIIANWAFFDISQKTFSALPWFLLVVFVGATIITYSLSFFKEMEP